MAGRSLKVPASFYAEDFESLLKQEQTVSNYRKLLALHHVQQGDTLQQAAEKLCTHYRTVQDWLVRYCKGGISGLARKKTITLRRRSPQSEEALFKARCISMQADRCGGSFTAKDAQQLLKLEFACELKQSAVYMLLHRVGLSWISGRDQHPKSDTAAQETFKKTSSSKLGRWFPSPLG